MSPTGENGSGEELLSDLQALGLKITKKHRKGKRLIIECVEPEEFKAESPGPEGPKGISEN